MQMPSQKADRESRLEIPGQRLPPRMVGTESRVRVRVRGSVSR